MRGLFRNIHVSEVNNEKDFKAIVDNIRKLKGEENHFPRFLTKSFFCSTPIEVSFC